MKNYKRSVSLGLAALLVISLVYQFNDRIESRKAYQADVKKARNQVETGLGEEAEISYLEALTKYPNLDLYRELGEFYINRGQMQEAKRLYQRVLLDKYPEEPETYLFGIQAFLKDDHIKGAFEVYTEGVNRCDDSEALKEAMKSHWYDFELVEKFSDVRPFSGTCRRAAVCGAGGWYYIDTDGGLAFDGAFQAADAYTEFASVVDLNGRALCISQGGMPKITSGVIEKADPEFGEVKQFISPVGGLLGAYNGKTWNYYDAVSMEKMFGGYQATTGFSNGVAGVSKDGQHWALLSAEGEELTKYEYDAVVTDRKNMPCRTSGVFVKKGWEYWLVDQTGKKLCEKPFEEVDAFCENSLAAVKQGGKWCFVNEAGEVSSLGDFQEAKSFSKGLAAVKQNDKWGYIDTEGKIVIECQFEDAQEFSAYGTAFVKSEGLWRLLRLHRMNFN